MGGERAVGGDGVVGGFSRARREKKGSSAQERESSVSGGV